MQTSVTLRTKLQSTTNYTIQGTTTLCKGTRLQRTTRYDKALQWSIREESAALETLNNSNVTDQDNGKVATLFSPNSHGGMKQMTQGPGVRGA